MLACGLSGGAALCEYTYATDAYAPDGGILAVVYVVARRQPQVLSIEPLRWSPTHT